MSENEKEGRFKNLRFLQFIKNNKSAQIALLLLAAAIIIIIFISTMNITGNQTTSSDPTTAYVQNMEQRLEKIISGITGAGKVTAMVTLESGSEYQYNGTTSQVIKETYPKIKGVVIVCTGGSDVKVKLEIYKAVQTLLDVNAGNIEVIAGK